MQFDYSKLEGRIIEKFGTRSAFAEAAGFTAPTLSSRLNGNTTLSCDEIYRISQPALLDIPPMEFHVYFFKPKFDK